MTYKSYNLTLKHLFWIIGDVVTLLNIWKIKKRR